MIRDILTKFTDYYNREDYTRPVKDTIRIGVDYKTKLKFDKYESDLKRRKIYDNALGAIEEPTFD